MTQENNPHCLSISDKIIHSILLRETTISLFMNVTISSAFAWFVILRIRPAQLVEFYNVILDLIITSFMIVFVPSVLRGTMMKQRIKKGLIPQFRYETPADNLLVFTSVRLLPKGVIFRALILGILALVIIMPISVLLLTVLGFQTLTINQFFFFKITVGSILALMFTPPLLLNSLALREQI